MLTGQEQDQLMKTAKQRILRAAARPITPEDLIRKVSSEDEGIDEYFVRAALWSLFDRGWIHENARRELIAQQ